MVRSPFRITRLELRIAIAAVFVALLAYQAGSRFLFRFDREPATLPLPEVSEETEASVQRFSAQLRAVIKEGAPLRTSLTENQLNAWLRLSTDQSLRLLAEHTWFSLRSGKAHATIALPLEIIGRSGLYFNGEATLSGSMESERIVLKIEQLKAKNQSSQGIAWLVGLLYRESLPGLLRLHELIPRQLLEHCVGAVTGEVFQLTCVEDRR
jgi:hypothetical protein